MIKGREQNSVNIYYPKVSIMMITYNHEKYISEAIESVLIQSYPNYELVIGEDYSTDNTLEIIKQYKEKFPNKIKVISNEVNIGMMQNASNTWNYCDGDYIAFLEGDDYWTSNLKLENQVKALTDNPNCSICLHGANVVVEPSKEVVETIPNLNNKKMYSFVDILKLHPAISTASIIINSKKFNKLPSWFNTLGGGDWAIIYSALSKGDMLVLEEVMSTYRVHKDGVWSSIKNTVEGRLKANEHMVDLFTRLDDYTNYQYSREIKEKMNKIKYEICMDELELINSGSLVSNFSLSYIQEFSGWEKRIQNKKVYIFGAGLAGNKCYELLNLLNFEIMGFIDNSNLIHGTYLYEKKIYSPIILDKEKDIFIFVASMYNGEIEKQLQTMGLKNNYDYISIEEILNWI